MTAHPSTNAVAATVPRLSTRGALPHPGPCAEALITQARRLDQRLADWGEGRTLLSLKEVIALFRSAAALRRMIAEFEPDDARSA